MARVTIPVLMTPIPTASKVAALQTEQVQKLTNALGVAVNATIDQTLPVKAYNDLKALPSLVSEAADKGRDYLTIALWIGGAFVALKLIQEGRKAFG